VLSKPCRASHFHISSILSRTLATFYGQEDTRINFTLRPSSDPYRILLKDIQRGPAIAACVLLLIKFAVNLRTNHTMITQRWADKANDVLHLMLRVSNWVYVSWKKRIPFWVLSSYLASSRPLVLRDTNLILLRSKKIYPLLSTSDGSPSL
jgi:hypothetical protein